MKKSTRFLSMDRATIFFFFLMFLMAADFGFLLYNAGGALISGMYGGGLISYNAPSTKDKYWGAEFVIMAFGYFFFLMIYLLYLNFRHWILLVIVQLLSVLYFFFQLVYDIVRTQNSIGEETYYTNKMQIYWAPWIVTPFALYTPVFMLFSFMLHDEIHFFVPPKRALALERVVYLLYYSIKKLGFRSKSADRWRTNKTPYVIRLDRNLLYFVFVLILIAWNLGMMFNNLENKQDMYQQRELILMCCFYFLFLFALYLHFCVMSFISLVLIQLLSVALFWFQWIYDLQVAYHNLGMPQLLGLFVKLQAQQGGGPAQVTGFIPVYITAFLHCSFLLRYRNAPGVPCGKEVYTLEGIGLGVCSLIKFLKKKILSGEGDASEYDKLITQKNVLDEVDEVSMSEKDEDAKDAAMATKCEESEKTSWIAFERPALYFLFVLLLFSVCMGHILTNMTKLVRDQMGTGLESMELNTQMIVFAFLLLFLLIISFWNVCTKCFVSLIVMQIVSVILFFVFMIYSFALARKKAVGGFLWYFDWSPWFSMYGFPIYGATFLLASFAVQTEKCCCATGQVCHHYSLEGLVSCIACLISRILFGAKSGKFKCGGDEDAEKGEDGETKKCGACYCETSFIFIDRNVLYYLLVLLLFSVNMGQILENLMSETKGLEYHNTQLIITSLFLFMYVLLVALYLNIRCPISLLTVQSLSFFMFLFRTIYDISLSNHRHNSIGKPFVISMMISGGGTFDQNGINFVTYYSSMLYLLSFCLKCDRVCLFGGGCGKKKKEGGYYALEGVVVQIKGLIKFIISKVTGSGGKLDAINVDDGKKQYEYVAIMDETDETDEAGYGSTDQKMDEKDQHDFSRPPPMDKVPVEEETEEPIRDDDAGSLMIDDQGEKVPSAPLDEGEISIDDQ